MDRTLLLGVGALLTFALVTGVVTLVKSGQARRLRDRVVSAGALEQVGVPTAGLPSIRLKTNETRPFVERVLRFLRYNPDVPQAQVVPWYLVLVFGVLVAVVVANLLARPLGLQLSAPFGVAIGFFAIRGVFAFQYNRYVDQIFKQIPDAIGLMVRAIRAGLPVGEAMRSVAAELSSPLRDEFSRMLGDVAIGRPVDQALMRLYRRTELPEFSFLAVVLGMQSQTGGNLAETLDNLADIVRKRVALSKRAKALAAEARMQAGILMVLPFVAALAMSQIQDFYVDQFSTPAGQKLALVGLGFSGFGFLVIRWLIKRAGQD
jgi:tight adherence protein B